jgi:deoxyxylulose-5-phosphate synthase
MFKLNSRYYVSEINNKIIKACNQDLIKILEDNLRAISSNLEFLDESKSTKQQTAQFIQYIKDEIQKIKQPYEHAKENLTSIEFYLKDLNQRVEDFLNYNMQPHDEGMHGLS